jgi:hypothetical protein
VVGVLATSRELEMKKAGGERSVRHIIRFCDLFSGDSGENCKRKKHC